MMEPKRFETYVSITHSGLTPPPIVTSILKYRDEMIDILFTLKDLCTRSMFCQPPTDVRDTPQVCSSVSLSVSAFYSLYPLCRDGPTTGWSDLAVGGKYLGVRLGSLIFIHSHWLQHSVVPEVGSFVAFQPCCTICSKPQPHPLTFLIGSILPWYCQLYKIERRSPFWPRLPKIWDLRIL